MAGKISFFCETPSHRLSSPSWGLICRANGWDQHEQLIFLMKLLPIGCHLLLEDGFRGLTAGISTNIWKNSFFFRHSFPLVVISFLRMDLGGWRLGSARIVGIFFLLWNSYPLVVISFLRMDLGGWRRLESGGPPPPASGVSSVPGSSFFSPRSLIKYKSFNYDLLVTLISYLWIFSCTSKSLHCKKG